jgi:hypothetical protein
MVAGRPIQPELVRMIPDGGAGGRVQPQAIVDGGPNQ